jgi:hypothetical protein
MYHHELEAELSGASEPEPLGYTRKQAGKEWFDEECEKVNEEMNASRANAIHRRTRAAKKIYRQAQSKVRNLFKEKSRQIDEEALIEID